MRAVGFGVDTQHAGQVGAFDEAAVEEVLPDVVEFVLPDPAGHSNFVVSFLAHGAAEHFGEPPNT